MESFIESVSLTSIFLFDFLDVHQNHSLSSTNNNHTSTFAFVALKSEGDLLGCFGFLSKDRFGLSTITGLLAIVTSSTLGSFTFLTLLVLGHFVDGVSAALAWAVCLPCLWYYHH
jgi:hypothetical protein